MRALTRLKAIDPTTAQGVAELEAHVLCRLAGQVRDVAYQGTTTDFWGALEAVGGPSTWRLGGALNCGKAQPGQVAAVSHGCPSALLRGINVLNTRTEGGR